MRRPFIIKDFVVDFSKSRVQAFTLIEILVTLALTSLTISLSYICLGHAQNIFIQYKEQNRFLTNFSLIKNQIMSAEFTSGAITEEKPNHFVITDNSSEMSVWFNSKMIVLRKGLRSDTLFVQVLNCRREYVDLQNILMQNKLLRHINLHIIYRETEMTITIRKEYDSQTLMAFETDL